MGKEVVQKKGNVEEEISNLNQLVKTLEDSFEKLKKAYEKQDPENFNRSKAILIQTQRRIFEVAK
ncbi:hypothetical protein J4422_04290 [Candidatus Pacearchaeota archaeon]|nr:hypothetical protein [Candidatus Pacearchaeota archaeon]